MGRPGRPAPPRRRLSPGRRQHAVSATGRRPSWRPPAPHRAGPPVRRPVRVVAGRDPAGGPLLAAASVAVGIGLGWRGVDVPAQLYRVADLPGPRPDPLGQPVVRRPLDPQLQRALPARGGHRRGGDSDGRWRPPGPPWPSSAWPPPTSGRGATPAALVFAVSTVVPAPSASGRSSPARPSGLARAGRPAAAGGPPRRCLALAASLTSPLAGAVRGHGHGRLAPRPAAAARPWGAMVVAPGRGRADRRDGGPLPRARGRCPIR